MKNKTYYVIECQNKFTGKAQITKLKATGFIGALLKLKKKRLPDRLSYNTIIVCADDDTALFYDKSM